MKRTTKPQPERNAKIKTLYRELCENRPIDVLTNKRMSLEDIRYAVGEQFGLSEATVKGIVEKKK